ncbi:hypothetical protein C8J57DRAFT_1092056, partial [Mycena rebaudengoi]
WILQIGPNRICAVTSDRAGNINKGRFNTVTEFPRILNFADACHSLHNTCKDMCSIPVFQPVRTIIFQADFQSRKDCGISRGLQSVGETRFATIYWSLDSILRGIPAFVKIVRNPLLGIDNEHFKDDEDVFKLQLNLTRLGNVLMPIARAIQCLESKDTTPADVYLYWLAIVAQLNDLLRKDSNAGKGSRKPQFRILTCPTHVTGVRGPLLTIHHLSPLLTHCHVGLRS